MLDNDDDSIATRLRLAELKLAEAEAKLIVANENKDPVAVAEAKVAVAEAKVAVVKIEFGIGSAQYNTAFEYYQKLVSGMLLFLLCVFLSFLIFEHLLFSPDAVAGSSSGKGKEKEAG